MNYRLAKPNKSLHSQEYFETCTTVCIRKEMLHNSNTAIQ